MLRFLVPLAIVIPTLWVACILLIASPRTTEHDFLVIVRGSPGLVYSGNIMVIKGTGQSQSVSVNGEVGDQYNLRGKIVSLSFQKGIDMGARILEVVITRDGIEILRQQTTVEYGLVTLATY